MSTESVMTTPLLSPIDEQETQLTSPEPDSMSFARLNSRPASPLYELERLDKKTYLASSICTPELPLFSSVIPSTIVAALSRSVSYTHLTLPTIYSV